jgi:hypothetical protein
MSNIPYGNIGPDHRMRFTKRLAMEVRTVSRQSPPEGVHPSDWDEVLTLMETARALPDRTSRLSVNLGKLQPEVCAALREALMIVAKENTHVQVYQSAHSRAEEIANYLDISAIERLADLGADLKSA